MIHLDLFKLIGQPANRSRSPVKSFSLLENKRIVREKNDNGDALFEIPRLISALLPPIRALLQVNLNLSGVIPGLQPTVMIAQHCVSRRRMEIR